MRKPKYPQIRFLVDSYYAVQKMRCGSDNRVKALKRSWNIPATTCKEYQINIGENIKNIEEWLEDKIKEEVKYYPIWTEWLKNIKGIGHVLAGGLLAWIYGPVEGTYKFDKQRKLIPIRKGKPIKYDAIGRFDTISKLYKYCGENVEDGRAVRREKNKQSNWNSNLKTHVWKISESFIKCGRNGDYRKFYDSQKKRYKKEHPKKIKNPEGKGRKYSYTKGHIHNMAARKMRKLFLAHLWLVWRELEGLPTESPYPIAHLKNHNHFIPPYKK